MKYSYNELNKIAEKYLAENAEISELEAWGKGAYYEFLMHDFLSIDKIYTYHFIRIFSEYPEEINKALKIINSNEDYFFRYKLNIPWENKRMAKYKNIRKIYENLYHLILEHISDRDKDIYIEKTNFGKRDIVTVLDLLEFKIMHMINDLIYEGNILGVGYSIEMFPDNAKQHNSNDLYKAILAYIECLLGRRGIIIEVKYFRGNADLDIFPEV